MLFYVGTGDPRQLEHTPVPLFLSATTPHDDGPVVTTGAGAQRVIRRVWFVGDPEPA